MNKADQYRLERREKALYWLKWELDWTITEDGPNFIVNGEHMTEAELIDEYHFYFEE